MRARDRRGFSYFGLTYVAHFLIAKGYEDFGVALAGGAGMVVEEGETYSTVFTDAEFAALTSMCEQGPDIEEFEFF